jgi:hypothetical protein
MQLSHCFADKCVFTLCSQQESHLFDHITRRKLNTSEDCEISTEICKGYYAFNNVNVTPFYPEGGLRKFFISVPYFTTR